ncbi:hypothetical protein ACFOE1_18625 [Agromyces mediolanus]|uniref:hypothetical protein n=1 Tax=Agromyces mediolanus TaxID=41986 RepID=UPI0036111871
MPPEPARSVRATWLYTLVSIVFFYGFFDLIVGLTLFEAYLAERTPLVLAVLLLQLLATAAQLRYCWFLRVGRGGGLPHPAWTVTLLLPAVLVWALGLLAPGLALTSAMPLWAALTLVAPPAAEAASRPPARGWRGIHRSACARLGRTARRCRNGEGAVRPPG